MAPRLLRPAAAVVAACLLLGAGPLHADSSVAAQAQTLLRTHCGRCHGPGGRGKGGFDYLLDRERLVARGQVIPGDAPGSQLFQRVAKHEMPPPGSSSKPGPDGIALLRRWIEAGAPGVEATPRGAWIHRADLLRAIRADLHALPPRQRRFSRYLTLAHLANAGLPAEERQRHRYALSKLVNSLSWHPRITRPHPLDAARTLYRIDLREYRWNARLWDRLASTSPYRLANDDPVARECARLTGSDDFLLRGDWFTAIASRPPFYHDFLGLPGTARALEQQLQVDVAADIQDDTALRAGFNDSGVARNNRVIERHDGTHGAYWRSYDFNDNTGRQNVFERPLGPAPGALSFRHVGGEVIFNLPNGLQGYLLVDADGRRIDKAPGEVVSDPRRPDRRVENGLSCMGCHVRGLLPKNDQVRAHVLKNKASFPPADGDAILALYVPAARFQKRMQEDTERFTRALARAGVPEGDPEPISTVTLRYEGVLGLREAAAEVDRSPDELAAALRRAPELARTLGPLLARGGTVTRQVLEENYPALVRTLGPVAAPAAETVTAFTGHRGAVHGLAFSADGRLAASAGADDSVRIWDLASGRERQRCLGHRDEAACVAFTPDCSRVLSGGRDRSLRFWDVKTGRELRRCRGHTDAVRAVAVAPDGRRALSGGADRTLRLWDLSTGKEMGCWTGHEGAVTCVAFSPDGRLALSGSLDRSLRLWDVKTGRERAVWKGPGGAVYSVAFAPDGRQAVSGGNDHLVRLWDVATGKELRRFEGHTNAVVCVACAGGHVLSGSSQYARPDRIVLVWDVATGKERHAVDGKGLEQVECLAFAADGRRVLLSHAGGLRLASLPR